MYIKDLMKTDLFVLSKEDKISLAPDVMKYKKNKAYTNNR